MARIKPVTPFDFHGFPVRVINDGHGEPWFNNRSQSWPVTFTGLKPRIKEIMDFIDRHKGSKGFLWEPPLGELGLYKCNGYKPVHRGGQVYAITATFQQTFHP
ncbi:phage tail protein [Pseudomonas rhodesiae]|nr:phage tail protein [Pseudomonas rhodesiae]